MRLLFDSGAKRHPRSGFTLIEVLIAFAISAMVLGTVMVTLSRTTQQQAKRLHQLWLTELAYSVLQLHTVTGVPGGKAEGKASSAWNWRATETTANPNPVGVLDASMAYAVIKVTVWNELRPEDTLVTDTIVARRK